MARVFGDTDVRYLKAALRSGKLRYAGLDTFPTEPNDDVDLMAVCGQSFGEALGVALGAANRRQVGVGGEGDAQRCQLGGHC